ncbi:DUF418 domain-containing protein [Brevundimonas naejangsanensis]|uniref:DUF418 domain-containing protein n=1 Tax=Brevundimonas naejangsanensis TaxID=588932 RepID=A0A494RCT6_9CAUL|nr:DUF418 domain-containing protein [Brevundimonas naejangsanensis]AYG94105.1 DUF418 domain-containing protein [Brevundimonas naejangsanensis]
MSTAARLAPVPASQRLESLDLLRGFALCGILLVNIMPMGGPWEGYHPSLPATLANPDWSAWVVQHLFFQGAMRGLFTLLFGAGMLLITLRGEESQGTIQSADVYFRRCMALLALGVFNATCLLFPGDILYVYGLSGFLLFVFRTAAPRTLLRIAALLILLLTIETAVVGHQRAAAARHGQAVAAQGLAGDGLVAAEQAAATAPRTAAAARLPDPQALQEEAAIRTGGPVGLLEWSVRTWLDYAASSYTITLVLESAAFMLAGMALFKLGVLTGRRSLGFYVGMAAVGYGLGLLVNGVQAIELWRSQFAPGAWVSQASYEIGRCSMTLGHVGLVLVLWKLNAWGVVGVGLRAMGRMALTNYLLQSAIAALLFYGFGLWGRLDWWGLWGLAVGVWVAQALFSLAWLQAFAFGPMEWLLRWVAYGRPAPLRRRLIAAEALAERSAG